MNLKGLLILRLLFSLPDHSMSGTKPSDYAVKGKGESWGWRAPSWEEAWFTQAILNVMYLRPPNAAGCKSEGPKV